MTDWFKASIDLQQQMLDASRQAIGAGQPSVDPGAESGEATAKVQGEAVAKVQEASQQAIDANVKAWSAWMNLWGGAW